MGALTVFCSLGLLEWATSKPDIIPKSNNKVT